MARRIRGGSRVRLVVILGQKARCAARKTESRDWLLNITALLSFITYGLDTSIGSIGAEVSSEVTKVLCRLTSRSIHPASTSLEAPSA